MNTNTSPSSGISSNKRFDLGVTIRDSIFYYEDLMGDQNDLPVLHNQEHAQESEHDSTMAMIFDEIMFENQYRIQDPKREETIKALLNSIESFKSDSTEEESD
jgi:hypothetical protein